MALVLEPARGDEYEGPARVLELDTGESREVFRGRFMNALTVSVLLGDGRVELLLAAKL